MNFDSLIEDLSFDVKLSERFFDLQPITIYNRSDVDHLSFVFFQLFLNEFCLKSSSSFDSTNFFEILRTYYQTNANRLEQIEHLNEIIHSSKKFLRFYRQNSFVGQILQKSLQNFDLKILFSMRFLIENLHRSSNSEFHFETDEIFYRSQILSEETFGKLKSNIGSSNFRCFSFEFNFVFLGELLSINNFFFANQNRAVCLGKLRELNLSDKRFSRILFQIQIPREYHFDKTRPIIIVNSHEKTIFFSIGSIFRIDQVVFDINNDCSIVQLTIFDQQTNDQFNDLFAYFNSKKDPLVLAHLLRQISPQSAQLFYKHLLNDNNQLECYIGLGLCSYLQKDFTQALEYFHRALEIPTESRFIQSSLHNSMGLVCAQLNQIHQADEHFRKSLEFSVVPLHRAAIHHNLALISSEKGRFDEEIFHYEQAFQIRTNQSSTNQLEIACLINNLGIAHADLNQYDKALSYLKQALEIRLKHLPEYHVDIAKSYANIGTVYVKSKDLHVALDYFKKALLLFQKQTIQSNEEIQAIQNNIQIVRDKLN